MICTVDRWGEVVVVSIVGDVDMYTAQQAGDFLHNQIEKGAKNLVIDFSQVTYLSSAGLRVLRITARECRTNSGDVRLAKVNPDVAMVLRLSGFDQFILSFSDVNAAIASFNS
jgi:anti-anti-sigma factor